MNKRDKFGRNRGRLAGWAVLLLASCFPPALQGAELRALIVTGWYDHSFLKPVPALRQLLSESGRFRVDVTEDLPSADLTPYDVLVLLYNGPRWPPTTERAVEQFVASGKGMVTIHGTTYAFGGVEVRKVRFQRSGIIQPPWKEFVKMIGCQWPEERLGHGKRHRFAVRFTDQTHPVTRGLPASLMADDELYHRITVLPQAHVLATAFDDPKIRGTGKDEPVMWVVHYGRGRIFHTTLGHDPQAIRAPAFVRVVPRAAAWAATGEVRPALAAAVTVKKNDDR